MQITTNQQHVLSALREAKVPLSAYTLLDRLRDQGFSAPVQIYRALDRLTEYGLIHRLESLNAYVSCIHDKACRHDFTAFAICDSCGHVDEFIDDSLSRSLGYWMKNHAFSLGHSTIELHGKCAHCTGHTLPS